MNLDFKSFAQLEKPAEVMQYLQSLAETRAPLRKNAVIYIRKSRMILTKKGEGKENETEPGEVTHSPQFQEQTCRQLAENQGWNILAVFMDLNKSGKNSKRDEFQNMLALVRSGQVDYVLVYSTDRSFRNGTSLLQFVSDLHKMGTELVSATEPMLDCRTLSGRLMLACMSMITELPVWNSSERTRDAKRTRLESGLPNGGPPYGYCTGLCKTCHDLNGEGYCPLYGGPDRPESERGRVLVPHPIEQHAVRLIAHLYLQGLSDIEIAMYLNRNTFELPDGSQVKFRSKGLINRFDPGELSRNSVRDIVRNPFHAGYVTHYYTEPLSMNDDLEHPERIKNHRRDRRRPEQMEIGRHQPLYPVEIWKQIMQLRDSKRGTPTRKARPGITYLLSGIAHCWECYQHDGRNAGLRGSKNGSGRQKYRCATLLDKHHFSPAPVEKQHIQAHIGITPSMEKHDDWAGAHPKFSLDAEKVDEQVYQFIQALIIPGDWHNGIAAHYLSDNGMSEFEMKSKNLHQELERYKSLLISGHIDKAEFDQHGLRLHREIQKLQPLASPEAQTILPMLDDFPALWMKFSVVERRALLKVMISGLYFDKDGNLRKVIAYSPFDKILGQKVA